MAHGQWLLHLISPSQTVQQAEVNKNFALENSEEVFTAVAFVHVELTSEIKSITVDREWSPVAFAHLVSDRKTLPFAASHFNGF